MSTDRREHVGKIILGQNISVAKPSYKKLSEFMKSLFNKLK